MEPEKALGTGSREVGVIIPALPFAVWPCASHFLVWGFLLLLCEIKALLAGGPPDAGTLGLSGSTGADQSRKKTKKTEVPFWHLEMKSRETMSVPEVDNINLIKDMMQHWRQSDCVSADCWVTGSTGGPAGPEKTNYICSQQGTDAGQKWAPLATLEWLDSSLVRCVRVQCREQW